MILFIGDVLVSLSAYLVVLLIRFAGAPPAENTEAVLRLLPVLVLAAVLLLWMYRCYRDLHRPYLEIAAGVAIAVMGAALVTMGAAYALTSTKFPRSVFLGGVPLQFLLLTLWRLPFVAAAKRSLFLAPIIVVSSSGRKGLETASRMLPRAANLVEALKPQEVLLKREMPAQTRILILPDVPPEWKGRLLMWAASRGIEALLVPSPHDLLLIGGRHTLLHDTPIFEYRPLGLRPEHLLVKRVIDIVFSLVLLVLALPVFLIAPVLIYLDSPGPVFYLQERVGLNGKIFKVIKFRTMIPDAERKTGPVLASKTDSRVTRVGRFLRATRLDELPQLWNVLIGDMSLVGPRPERPIFVQQFQSRNPEYGLRHAVKPGITGLAQVMGRYDTSPDNKLRFDLLYISTYSPWLDLLILIWTIQVVLFPQTLVDSPPSWLRRLEEKAWSVRVGRGLRQTASPN